MNTKRTMTCMLIVFAVLLLCIAVQAQDEESWLPAPTGSYQVGTTTYYWVDEARDEILTDDPNDKRELVVRIWYPADVEDGATPIPYFPNGEADVRGFQTSHEADMLVGNALVADFPQTPTHSYLDAPLSNAQASYPVLINTSPPFISFARNEELASHGYVVVSVYQTYIGGWTVFPDGREVATKMFVDEWFMALDDMAKIAAEDMTFVLNQLGILNANSQDRFGGYLELDNVGIFGSSFGAGVAMLASMRDSRIQATVAVVSHGMAPGDVMNAGLDLPIMFLDAEGEPSDQTLASMRGPAYMLTLNGMTSFSVGDFGVWPGTSQDFQDNWLGTVDPARAIQIANNYILAFFDQYLKGEDQALLQGSSDDYPEVAVESRNVED